MSALTAHNQLRPAIETLEARHMLDAALVKDIDTVTASSAPEQLTTVGDVVYFAARSDSDQPSHIADELWRSDGSEEGTQQVGEALDFERIDNLTSVGSSVLRRFRRERRS